ncbi:DUF4435 domain-containing protein [Roseivirga sp.]|uniref:DUF4435 domain-containing protein n=1 Tax=Roseivirga sp. TaxID=1964215 RepID=UPI002B276F34|nr:DUF4435 domain-containing protein [Roseivirga sp.]
MSIIEEAKAELGSGLVAYTEFVLDFKKGSKAVYCFYEGKEDRSFYSHRVKMLHPQNDYLDYICLGKDNVIKVRSLINHQKGYSECNIGYFIDSDFDPKNTIQDIYSTPCYSIENLFVVDSAFENILLNEFNISRQCQCFNQIISFYKSSQHQFHEQSILLNSWLACQADYRSENKISTRLGIDDKIKSIIKNEDFNKVVSPDLKSINFPADLLSQDKIEGLFPDAPKIPKKKLDDKILEFDQVQKELTFRGKFELRFLISFLNRLQSEIGKTKGSLFKKKYSCSLRFEYTTAISQLTNNSETPPCLVSYINGLKKSA